ncbi:MAG: RNHCP domain-containing protein [Spirochaetae bacterium HGW-Spirochaetae-5]|nr:MAG: RNHCP domain-containing protein [Spirochaetae bacterium HGW-Spirochaetae-5]
MSRSDRKYINEHNAFICEKCGRSVVTAISGTLNRNHCPECLWSRHVDLRTGDRMSVCRGMMEPIGIWVRLDGEWALIHRCVKCGFIRSNRIAGDDNQTRLMHIAVKPVKMFPFPDNTGVYEKIEIIIAEAIK